MAASHSVAVDALIGSLSACTVSMFDVISVHGAQQETRYGNYWEGRLTIVANLQATVSAHSEDWGSSSASPGPQTQWPLISLKPHSRTLEKCRKSLTMLYVDGFFRLFHNESNNFSANFSIWKEFYYPKLDCHKVLSNILDYTASMWL